MDKQTVLYIFSLLFAIGVDSLPDKSAMKSQVIPGPNISGSLMSGKKDFVGKSDKYEDMAGQYYGAAIPADYGAFAGGLGSGLGLGGLGGLGLFGGKGLLDPTILLPIILIAGLGMLLLPLLGTFVSTLFTTPVNTLVTGRRRRRFAKHNNGIHEDLVHLVSDLWERVGGAFDKYSAQSL